MTDREAYEVGVMPLKAATLDDGRRYYRPKDVATATGIGVKRLGAQFGREDDPSVVEAALQLMRPRRGRQPQWVVPADPVDKFLGQDRLPTAVPEGGAVAAEGPPPQEDPLVAELRRLRADLLQQEAAVAVSLDERERLLRQQEQMLLMNLEGVRAQLRLMEEMQRFRVPSYPPSERAE